MNRRDFWKWLGGMLATPTALLVVRKAQAEETPKPDNGPRRQPAIQHRARERGTGRTSAMLLDVLSGVIRLGQGDVAVYAATLRAARDYQRTVHRLAETLRMSVEQNGDTLLFRGPRGEVRVQFRSIGQPRCGEYPAMRFVDHWARSKP